jgi:hypothetical protein
MQMTSSTKDENNERVWGRRECDAIMRGRHRKPPGGGWDRWKVTKRNLCCWREAFSDISVPVGGKRAAERAIPGTEAVKLRCMDSGFCRTLLSLTLTLCNMEGLVSGIQSKISPSLRTGPSWTSWSRGERGCCDCHGALQREMKKRRQMP